MLELWTLLFSLSVNSNDKNTDVVVFKPVMVCIFTVLVENVCGVYYKVTIVAQSSMPFF